MPTPTRHTLWNILAMTALLGLLVVVYREYVAVADIDRYAQIVQRGYQSFTALSIVYIVSSIVEFLVTRNVQSLKVRKYAHKMVTGTALVVAIVLIGFIWISQRETFTTYFGFVTIAIAVSFQDLFKNLVGSLVINTTRNIEIGDSIEVAGHIGQVVEIGFLYTTLLETGSWDDVAQVNNKEIKLPNQVFSNQVAKSYDVRDRFIWDQIDVALPDTSRSLVRLEKSLLKLVRAELSTQEQPSKQFLKRLNRGLVGVAKSPYPVHIYFEFEGSGVRLSVRYLVSNNSVREVRSRLTQLIAKRIYTAKTTLDK